MPTTTLTTSLEADALTAWYALQDDLAGAAYPLAAPSAGTASADATAETALLVAGPLAQTGASVVLDESSGLQNSTATPLVAGDANDNDIAVASLNSVFAARLTALGAGTPLGAALSGYTGAALNTGSDAFTVSAGGAALTNLKFTDSGGAALNGLDSLLTTVGATPIHILLYTDTGNDNIVLGRAGAGGPIVFAAYIDETATGGKLWTVQYQPLFNPNTGNPDDAIDLTGKVFIGVDQEATFSLAGAPSGQNLFLMYTAAGAVPDAGGRIPGVSIIATGKDPANESTGVNISTGDTVNTSQAGGPTTFGTNSQMITEQEGIRFSFVTGALANFTVPNLDQTEADVEANINFTTMFGARSSAFDVVQLQSGKSAQVKITALSTAAESGVNFIDGYANDSTVAITSVVVKNTATGLAVSDVVITFSGGIATITGVKAGYTIQYTTTGDHNRVLIENGAALNASGQTHADFDIGGFRVLQASSSTLEIGSKMVFEDDGPSTSLSGAAGPTSPHVDETDLPGGASTPISFSDFFTPGTASAGADGGGSTVTSSFSIALVNPAGSDSGLVDTLSGDKIYLYLNGTNQIVGKVGLDDNGGANSSGAIAFTVDINTTTGDGTLTQQRSLVHANTLNPNDSVTLGANLFNVTRSDTITDREGDSFTTLPTVVTVGAFLRFDDDGPSVSATAASTPTLTTDDTRIPDSAGPISFAGLFSASFGKDSFKDSDDNDLQDADAITYSLGVSSGGVASGLVDTLSGNSVALFLQGGDVVGRIGGAAGTEVFRIHVDANSGDVTLTQSRAVVHDNPADPVETGAEAAVLGAASLVTLTAKATDGDGDTASATRNIGDAFKFEDDGPSITVSTTAPPDALTVDETVLADNATANYADNFGNAPLYGADGAGTVTSAYALSVSSASVASGLVDVASGQNVLLTLNGSGVVEGRTATSGLLVFNVSVSAGGTVTLNQERAVVHLITTNPDDSVTLAAADLIKLTRTDTITDKDGDSSTGSAFINIGQALNFEDDGPSILARTDLMYPNASNPSPGGTGVFDYEIGNDVRLSFSAANSDFSAITLGGTVGTVTITNPTVTWSSETATGAAFSFSFAYQPNPSSSATTTANGTLSFDKVAGTYSVSLNAPVSGFEILTTGKALGFTGYTVGTSTVDQTQPDVSVAQLSSNFFVQFTGYSEPGAGTGANNLQAGTTVPTAFVNGEVFTQATTWVSVSNSANGTAGDTIQKGEVLDLDFFATNPTGFSTLAPTTKASGIFLKFDGIGSEDLVVVLKLVDANGNHTTKALIIDNADISQTGGPAVPPGYGIVLDQNDGAVVIESNDFNGAGETWLIEGAQLLVSTEGITGTAINLNAAIGTGGGSTGTQAFGASTTDNDVIKISDIGFITASSGTLNANLSFAVAVVDKDGDKTSTQTLDVTIVGGTTFNATSHAETLQAGSGNDTFVFEAVSDSAAGANHDLITGFLSGSDKIDLSGIDANTGGGANDAFVYIGGGPFTAAGQLRFDAANSMLQGDTNGDGVADFEVQLVGVVAVPPVGDIVL